MEMAFGAVLLSLNTLKNSLQLIELGTPLSYGMVSFVFLDGQGKLLVGEWVVVIMLRLGWTRSLVWIVPLLCLLLLLVISTIMDLTLWIRSVLKRWGVVLDLIGYCR